MADSITKHHCSYMPLLLKNQNSSPNPNPKWRSYLLHTGLAGLVYLVITLFIFRHRWINGNLSTQYSMPGIDTDGTMWAVWAINYKGGDTSISDLWSYPYGFDFTSIPINFFEYFRAFVLGLLGGQWPDLVLIFNLAAILAYPLAAIAMFIFAHYLTRDFRASFIAGIIFGFSHYFILMGRGSLSNNHFELIPLFYWAICYGIDKGSRAILALGAVIMAIQFGVNAYWGFFAGLFTPIVFYLYGGKTLKERIGSFGFFVLFSIGAMGLINYELLSTQFALSQSVLKTIIRPPNELTSQLIHAIAIFAPPANGKIYPWSSSQESFFLGYFALIVVMSACFIKGIWRNDKFVTFLACFLATLPLAANFPLFHPLNYIYLELFGTFRAYSRLIILASFFLAILAAIAIKYFYDLVDASSSQKMSRFAHSKMFLIAITTLIVFEGLSNSPSFYQQTDFQEIARVYDPLKRDQSINAIAAYPMTFSNGDWGAPPNPQIMGQIVHNKPLAGGKSLLRYSTEKGGNASIDVTDISNPETISKLISMKIDTILIYEQLLPDSKQIIWSMRHDNRITSLGRLPLNAKGEQDPSLVISVFKLKLQN